MKRYLLAVAAVIFLSVPVAAEWSASPYGDRKTYHTPGRTDESAGVKPQGRDAAISPAGVCWLVGTRSLSANAPPGDWKQYIPFKSTAEFDSYRAGNGQAARPPVQCAFNMPVSLCGASVGQTGHRALGTVVGPFSHDTGTETVTLTLRAEHQGTPDDYGWSVAAQSGSCAAVPAADCSDSSYAAAHPDLCILPDSGDCDDPIYSAGHPAECGALDPYCPVGYTTHILIGLIPTYYDASGAAHGNPHTLVTCARTSPTLALATPTSCRYSPFQSSSIRHTSGAGHGFPNVGFCGYDGSLDTRDYNVQWGDFPTFCAHDVGAGWPCGSDR